MSLSEIPKSSQPDNETQLVVFCVAGTEMCVQIGHVLEIIRVAEITVMPRAPKFLEGIINLRGRIIPVLDLKRRFNMPLVDRTSESRILVVEVEGQMVGLLVDKVLEVLKGSALAGFGPKEQTLNIGPEFIKEVLALGRRQILFLNLTRLFDFDEARLLSK